MNRFSKHWRKTGFLTYLISHTDNFVIVSRGLAAKAMAWMKAVMTKPAPPPRRGLRKLSPDLISKASDETAAQVTRIGLTFLGTTAFCFLSLFSPDSALLGGSEKISVPLAGPVSFSGFMLLGPAVLITLRVYLQIYVEYSDWLDRLARRMSAVRAPNLVRENWLLRLFSWVIFYLLLPAAMLFFAWKAAVFPTWGLGLLCIALGVIASHAMLWLNRFCKLCPLPLKVLTSVNVCAVFVVLSIVFSVIAPDLDSPGVRRPFNLDRANLSGQWFHNDDLRDAHLTGANLSRADLGFADLSGAGLHDADLTSAKLTGAHLTGADLTGANLTGADLTGANLTGADLSFANLHDAKLGAAVLTSANLTGANLSGGGLHDADLTGAKLSGANLSGANLILANLSNVNLSRANLSGADLRLANLSGANLAGVKLSLANLSRANLTGAEYLAQEDLIEACGDARTKLPEGLTMPPEGLTIKPCETTPPKVP